MLIDTTTRLKWSFIQTNWGLGVRLANAEVKANPSSNDRRNRELYMLKPKLD